MTSVRRHCITTILIVCLLNVVYCQLIATANWGNQNGVTQAQFGLSQLPSASEDVDDKIAISALQFALNVGLQLSDSGNGASSEVFSPLSVMSALALLMLGAKGNSFEELRHLFQLNYDPNKFLEEFGHMLQDVQKSDINSQEKLRPLPNWRTTRARNNIRRAGSRETSTPYDYTLKVANGIFTQQNYQLNPDYRQVVTSLYKSDLTQLDFYNNPATAVFTINDWVNRSTFGKIPQIISQEISKYTNVIIGSALYFKGFWENSFYEMATDWDDFYADGPQSKPIKVRMMATGGEFPFYNAKEYGCRIIGLPYKGNLTTMYIIHPNNSTRQNLAALQRSLTADTIDYMISRMVQSSALVALPKLKFTRTHNMKNILGRLGVRDIFASGISDLSLIGKTPTYVASVPEVAKYIEREPEVGRTTTPFVSKTQNPHNYKDRFDEPARIWTRFGGVQEDKNKESLNSLHLQRTRQIHDRSELFVDDILHKVVFDVNEHGTEAAAATLAVLFRSGTDVLFRLDSPFIILIRHDLTKLPLFYGVINEPILE